VSWEISHFKLPADVAKKIGGADHDRQSHGARGTGQEVWVDQYPYTASSTSISTLLPDWVLENGSDDAKKILKDPKQIARVLKDMHDNYELKRGRKTLAYAVNRIVPGVSRADGARLGDGGADPQAPQVWHGRELLSENPEKLPAVTMEGQYRAR
jgi:N-acyl-D-aspartate/D-glutamate deacylase